MSETDQAVVVARIRAIIARVPNQTGPYAALAEIGRELDWLEHPNEGPDFRSAEKTE